MLWLSGYVRENKYFDNECFVALRFLQNIFANANDIVNETQLYMKVTFRMIFWC